VVSAHIHPEFTAIVPVKLPQFLQLGERVLNPPLRATTDNAVLRLLNLEEVQLVQFKFHAPHLRYPKCPKTLRHHLKARSDLKQSPSSSAPLLCLAVNPLPETMH
jgi:hypothetical protein